jgi:stage III sporulation protein SpoIIIAA
MDLGRPPEGRFPSRAINLSELFITREDIDYVIHRCRRLSRWTTAPGSSVRFTAFRGSVIVAIRLWGLTCRVGRAVFGTVDILRDVIESGKSLLLLGRPGVRQDNSVARKRACAVHRVDENA